MTIRDIVIASGKTREQICEQAGISRTYLSLIENGRRQIGVSKARGLADALGVTPMDLRPDLAAIFETQEAAE